ncbi:SdpI family protein [Oscillibacter sp. 1-3]|uniref:SdpI family protein n=1 Tax=Oscillibacter sp. 1-3 TaxID=1235797 RepID=UPI00033C596E|nr:SdpI family protein [Oscillibacter sp. 1-3]EOS63472.1 hypothetical protein C816_03245 [Oscillibacter sp. 1-3]
MADLLFWLFMLVSMLLIPACMLYFGRCFQKKPPQSINSGYGYRTARSMQSQAAWDFAHAYSGRFWVLSGRPALAVSLVWMLLLFGQSIDKVGASAMVLTGIQMIPFLAVIPATEGALKRKFG